MQMNGCPTDKYDTPLVHSPSLALRHDGFGPHASPRRRVSPGAQSTLTILPETACKARM